MSDRKKTDFHRIVESKGWQHQDIAERWGVTPRQLSRIANKPKQKDLDAARGLPKANTKHIREKIMKRAVLIKLSEGAVKGGGAPLSSRTKGGEVYLNLDKWEQFSFGVNLDQEKVIQFSVNGEIGVLSFTDNGMGEYHRLKREIKEYMGITDDEHQ
jgi:DNA-binding Xre family transcriptional regulator